MDGAGQTDGWWGMSASKTLGSAAFAGPAHCLMLVWRPVGLDRDTAEALAEAITSPSASQASYSDHP
jgi:hypothetical protein